MAHRRILQAWALFALINCSHPAFASLNSCPSGPASHGAHCIRRQGQTFLSGYCSSVLAIATPTSTVLATSTDTQTVTSTNTTGVHTITEPPTTHLVTQTFTVNSTSTVSETSTSITTTFTSFNATTTTTSTSITYIYTCPSSSISVPASSSLRPSSSSPISDSGRIPLRTAPASLLSSLASSIPPYGNLSASVSRAPSGTGYATYSLPPYATGLAKREAAVFSKAPCLRHYINEYGRNGVRKACDCFALPTPTAVTTTLTIIDPSTTITSTNTVKVEGTISFTPTVTETSLKTRTKKFSTTTVITTSLATTVYGTFTATHVVTSTSFTSLPTPSSFNIFYIDSTANNTSPPANFFQAVTAPSGSGIMLAPESAADNFGLNILGRLVDFSAGNKFIVKDTNDLYPFEYLVTGALNQDSPICSLCNGFVYCDYPGTTGNTFAICFGYLALGQPSVFRQDANGDGQPDCQAIALQYK